MCRIFIIPVVLLLIFACSIVSASTYELELSQVGNKVVERHTINFDSERTLSLDLNSDASSISSKNSYSLEDGTITLIGKDLEFSYVTEANIEDADDGYLFVKTVRFYSDFDSSTIKLILDEGYFTDKEHLFPKPSSITTDGRQITLTWKIENAKSGDDIPIFARVMSPPPSKFIIYSFWISVFVLAVLIIYWGGFRSKKGFVKSVHKKQKKTNKERAEKFANIDKYLIESEKAVLNQLREADRGELWQKQLQLATGFSKAKLSRVIRNLESRNLIEKIAFGNTNKVRLK